MFMQVFTETLYLLVLQCKHQLSFYECIYLFLYLILFNLFIHFFQEIQIGPDHQAEVPEAMGPNYQDGEF